MKNQLRTLFFAIIMMCAVLVLCSCSAAQPEISQPGEQTQLPADTGETEQSNGEQAYPMAESLRAEISTVEQAAQYLDERFPTLWMSMHMNNGQDDIYWLRSGAEILEDTSLAEAGRSCVANAVTYLLADDMEIYTVIGFWSDGSGGCPLKAINCIVTDDGCEFVDVVQLMSGDKQSRYGEMFPEGNFSSMEEYIIELNRNPIFLQQMYSIYAFGQGEKLTFTMREDGWTTMISPETEPLCLYEDNYISDAALEEMLYGHIKPENIDSYGLSGALGGVTLTPDEARELVDAEPEEIKERVRTAADVLMYMLAARIGDCGGCFCDEWDGYIWHTNLTASQVIEQRLANCGASANLANYLLEGDYDEVGIILHAYYPGNGGGHVYNYFLYEGSYYIVDLSWYIFANYDTASDFPVMKLDSLEQYGTRVHELYQGVSLVICHTSTGQHLPNIFGEDFGDNHYYVPEGADYTVLYQSSDGYLIGEMPLDRKYHDWTRF